MKFTKHESYPAAIASLQRAQAGPLDVQHVDFDEDAALALGSPVTEVVTMVPKPGVDKKPELLTELRVNMNAQSSCRAFVAGGSRENKGTLFVVLGWDSVQVCGRSDRLGKCLGINADDLFVPGPLRCRGKGRVPGNHQEFASG